MNYFFTMCLLILTFSVWAKKIEIDTKSPCYESIAQLRDNYLKDKAFKRLLDRAFTHVKSIPKAYNKQNPWKGKNLHDLIRFFQEWCVFLPDIKGSQDNGLKYIEDFAWFSYENPAGLAFVKESPGKKILQNFVRQRGKFMDSKDSTKKIAEWLKDPRIEKEDYDIPNPNKKDGGFVSFNEFFSRGLKDQQKTRPQTMPERDYIISAPTDCIINSIPQKIVGKTTPIAKKGGRPLNIEYLLKGSKYAQDFINGTALSCVLMPNTYHHFHAPVQGDIIESKIVIDGFFAYTNFAFFVPANGNVGYFGTDFNQFNNFQRGYFIVDTKNYGKVALIPVGLNTISSIVFEDKFKNIKNPIFIKRGDRLGHFLYGGSLFIMVFEPHRYKSGAVRVRLGNQIGIFDTNRN